MKFFTPILVALCTPMFSFSQDITGLWKGSIFNDSTKQSYEYEVVINKEKGKFTGYSETWYTINDKKYYGIKKLRVNIAKDGKVIMQDAGLIENNYPVTPPKNVYQLNILDLSNPNNESSLDGLFVTNRSKEYSALTGKINVKKVSLLSPSDLSQYILKGEVDNGLTVVK